MRKKEALVRNTISVIPLKFCLFGFGIPPVELRIYLNFRVVPCINSNQTLYCPNNAHKL